MSSESQPIDPGRFALAIQDLPMENIYSKAHEIENSIQHLQRSNTLLQEYSDSIRSDTSIADSTRDQVGDKDCLDAIKENDIVIERQKERIDLLRKEVERRGARWHGTPVTSGENGQSKQNGVNGVDGEEERQDDEDEDDDSGHVQPSQSVPQQTRQRLTDEELRQRMLERLAEDDPDEEVGMHL